MNQEHPVKKEVREAAEKKLAEPLNMMSNDGVPFHPRNTGKNQKLARGFPVQEGQDWRHLSAAQRKQWFDQHEERWKQRFGIKNASVHGDMNWTRG